MSSIIPLHEDAAVDRFPSAVRAPVLRKIAAKSQ